MKNIKLEKPMRSMKLFVLFVIAVIEGAAMMHAQDRVQVMGTVVDNQTDEPVIGVNVVEKGTTNGTVTDIDGHFSLSVTDNATLQASYVGYITQEIGVSSAMGRNLVIRLEEDVKALDEVVAVGYGVQKKSNVTGAIGIVKSEDIENRISEDVAHSIQGKVAGVQVLATSGAPNAMATFRIRGYSSTGSSDPLYIVDGLKVSDIRYLNQESIESIEILKDASSAAIYGAEAGNGVVLITTKKGNAGTGRIFYNMQLASSSEARKIKMMNAAQFKQYWIESGQALESSFGNADVDWQDEIFGNGLMQTHTVGFEGSNKDGALYVALNYLHNNGMVAGDKDINQRLSAQINASWNIKPWLTAGTTNSIERGYSSGVSENGGPIGTGTGSAIGGAYYYDPTIPVVYENDSDAPAHLLEAEAAGWNVFRRNGKIYGNSILMNSDLWNPYGMIDYADDQAWRTNVNGTVYGDFKPFNGLTVTSRLGYRINNNYSTRYVPPYYWNVLQKIENGSFQASNIHSFFYQWENFANYLYTFGKHDIAAMAGMQYARNDVESQSGSTNLLRNEAENYRYLDYSSTDANDVLGGNINVSSNISYFGRLSWTYDSRYTLQGIFRADAYDLSKLSANNRWGYFPSFSGSWNISNEQFMQDVLTSNILSSLKLRGSWGINGNISSLFNYPYSASLSLGGSDAGYYYSMSNYSGLITGAYPSSILPNPTLSWEESRQTNIGLDARFLDARLSFTVDWFEKYTTNMLSTISAPAISGTTQQTVNAGKIKNSGLEFELSYRDRIGKLKYSIDANLATIKNNVIESPYGETGRTVGGTNWFMPVTFFEAGYPIWYIRTKIKDHIDPDTGFPVYKTAEELGADDGLDYAGSGIPDFTYGVTLNLEYKGVDLKVFGTGVQGNESFLGIYRFDLPVANYPEFIFTERWTPQNPNATQPRPLPQYNTDYASSDFWVFDASYFKIKQIQLGYSIPPSILKSLQLTAFRAFVSLENFISFTSYPGNDPESMSSTAYTSDLMNTSTIGMDKVNYPLMKSIVFGVNVKF
jgi:TonB-linked SusC/RagA family outer membrane protein